MERKEISDSNTYSITSSSINENIDTSHSNKSDKNKIIIDFKTRREGVDKIIEIFEQKIKEKKMPVFIGDRPSKIKEKQQKSKNKEDENKSLDDLKSKILGFKNCEDFNGNPFMFYDELINEHHGNMDDEIFEEKAVELLKKKCVLCEYDEFPIFNKIKSKKKGTQLSQISYIEITSTFKGEKPIYNYFLKDGDDFLPINYPQNNSIFVLIEKLTENEKTNYMANFYFFNNDIIISKMFQKSKQENYQVSLTKSETKENYLSLMKDIERINTEIISDGKSSEEKKDLLNSKKDLNIKKVSLLKEETKIVLELHLEIKTQEYDGFFKSNKDNILKSNNNKMFIPKDSFVIVECKNNRKVDGIIRNISLKKRRLELLGINCGKLFFIGILYDVDNKDEKYFNDKNSKLSKNNIFLLKSKYLVSENEKFYEQVDEVKNIFHLINKLECKVDNIIENMINIKKFFGFLLILIIIIIFVIFFVFIKLM